MQPDVDELQRFYASRQGQLARRLIQRQLRLFWPDLSGLNVLGLGYAAPYLAGLDSTLRSISFMPVSQGLARWPSEGRGWAASSMRTTARSRSCKTQKETSSAS